MCVKSLVKHISFYRPLTTVHTFSGKAFASEHSVKEHQIVHKSQRNHCCAHCPKTFKTSSALKAHEAIHIGERCYKCSVCGKGKHSYHYRTNTRVLPLYEIYQSLTHTEKC